MTGSPEQPAPYQGLQPEVILDAIESIGLQTNGRQLALNSYENRVYKVGCDDESSLVIKFYRPGRWTDQAILEEHAYTQELSDKEIPVVAPLIANNGKTLHLYQGFRFAVYPCYGGRWPNLESPDTLQWLGRFIARIHAVGAIKPFCHRPTLTIAEFGESASSFLLSSGLLPDYLIDKYRKITAELLARIKLDFDATGAVRHIRLHGDCHPGNILWTEKGPHFVDFDDSRMGPAIQDIWMLLSGSHNEKEQQLGHFIEGYSEFFDFDPGELRMIEPLRTLRIINYAAWIARRWHDPAFPLNFPWFNSPRYWEDHINTLREQLDALDEPLINVS